MRRSCALGQRRWRKRRGPAAGLRGVPAWCRRRLGSTRFAGKPGLLGARDELGLSLLSDEIIELRCHPVLLMRELALVNSGDEGVTHPAPR